MAKTINYWDKKRRDTIVLIYNLEEQIASLERQREECEEEKKK